MTTGIEWTDETWNPTTGCDRCSPGCDHCYIERTVPFRMAGRRFDEHGKMGVLLHPDRLDKPLHWRKPRLVFVNSLSDLFHAEVPDAFIGQVLDVIGMAGDHRFQVLTKRPQRMAAFMLTRMAVAGWRPLPNLWLGTSIENDQYAFRANHLRRTPAAVRFLSCEPLLAALPSLSLDMVDWVIAGGESGPGARPMHPEWVRQLRDRCVAAGAAFFFKQWGEWAPVAPVYSSHDPFAHERVVDDAMDGGRRVVALCPQGHVAQVFEGGADGPVHTDHQPCPGAWWMERAGKKHAGRLLDGRLWDDMPKAAV